MERLGNGLLPAGLCLALSFINTVAGTDTSITAGFSQRLKQCISTDEFKENKEGLIKKAKTYAWRRSASFVHVSKHIASLLHLRKLTQTKILNIENTNIDSCGKLCL